MEFKGECYIYYPSPVPIPYQSERKASFPSIRFKDNDSFSAEREREPIMASTSSSSDNATKETSNLPDPGAAAVPASLPNVSQNSQNPAKGE